MQEERKGFGYWFKNVFWYHYGKLSLILLVVLVIGIFAIVEIVNVEKYDINVAVAVSDPIPYESTSELRRVIAEAVGDVDGNGEVNVNLNILDFSTGEDVETNYSKLALLMSQPEYTLFLMDDFYSSHYAPIAEFNDLADYGFLADTEYPNRMYVGDAPVLRRLSERTEFYICLADWTTDGKGDPAWTEAAIRAIHGILEAE